MSVNEVGSDSWTLHLVNQLANFFQVRKMSSVGIKSVGGSFDACRKGVDYLSRDVSISFEPSSQRARLQEFRRPKGELGSADFPSQGSSRSAQVINQYS